MLRVNRDPSTRLPRRTSEDTALCGLSQAWPRPSPHRSSVHRASYTVLRFGFYSTECAVPF